MPKPKKQSVVNQLKREAEKLRQQEIKSFLEKTKTIPKPKSDTADVYVNKIEEPPQQVPKINFAKSSFRKTNFSQYSQPVTDSESIRQRELAQEKLKEHARLQREKDLKQQEIADKIKKFNTELDALIDNLYSYIICFNGEQQLVTGMNGIYDALLFIVETNSKDQSPKSMKSTVTESTKTESIDDEETELEEIEEPTLKSKLSDLIYQFYCLGGKLYQNEIRSEAVELIDKHLEKTIVLDWNTDFVDNYDLLKNHQKICVRWDLNKLLEKFTELFFISRYGSYCKDNKMLNATSFVLLFEKNPTIFEKSKSMFDHFQKIVVELCNQSPIKGDLSSSLSNKKFYLVEISDSVAKYTLDKQTRVPVLDSELRALSISFATNTDVFNVYYKLGVVPDYWLLLDCIIDHLKSDFYDTDLGWYSFDGCTHLVSYLQFCESFYDSKNKAWAVKKDKLMYFLMCHIVNLNDINNETNTKLKDECIDLFKKYSDVNTTRMTEKFIIQKYQLKPYYGIFPENSVSYKFCKMFGRIKK